MEAFHISSDMWGYLSDCGAVCLQRNTAVPHYDDSDLSGAPKAFKSYSLIPPFISQQFETFSRLHMIIETSLIPLWIMTTTEANDEWIT